MHAAQKIELIDKIGRELQSRYSYSQIDDFLSAYDIKSPEDVTVNSKWVYSRVALRGVSEDKLIKIAKELDLPVPANISVDLRPPRNWQNTSMLKLFISHISTHKDKATRLKDCLSKHGIIGFVAHEDIHPTLEWQNEIERALHTMDAFLAIHTPGFSKSIWTQQEIGFAVCRGVKIISLKMGEDPTGFISKQQALSRQNRTAEEIAKEVEKILSNDPLTSAKLLREKIPDPMDTSIPF